MCGDVLSGYVCNLHIGSLLMIESLCLRISNQKRIGTSAALKAMNVGRLMLVQLVCLRRVVLVKILAKGLALLLSS
jgi:hypothetical protein